MAVKKAQRTVGNWLGVLVRGVGNEAEFGKRINISCSSPHFCFFNTSILVSSLFVYFFPPETPFHFTLPKEGDVIPPLTGATPPLVGHLKLEPRRHSTPIGEYLKCNAI